MKKTLYSFIATITATSMLLVFTQIFATASEDVITKLLSEKVDSLEQNNGGGMLIIPSITKIKSEDGQEPDIINLRLFRVDAKNLDDSVYKQLIKKMPEIISKINDGQDPTADGKIVIQEKDGQDETVKGRLSVKETSDTDGDSIPISKRVTEEKKSIKFKSISDSDSANDSGDDVTIKGRLSGGSSDDSKDSGLFGKLFQERETHKVVDVGSTIDPNNDDSKSIVKVKAKTRDSIDTSSDTSNSDSQQQMIQVVKMVVQALVSIVMNLLDKVAA